MNDSGFFAIKSSVVDFDDLYLSAVFPSTSRPSPSVLSPRKYTPLSCRQPLLRIVRTSSTSIIRQGVALPQGSPGLYHLSFLPPFTAAKYCLWVSYAAVYSMLLSKCQSLLWARRRPHKAT